MMATKNAGSPTDLRSDTVTKPSPAMLEAMMHAEVGDDVFGEDVTTNELQNEVAAMFGKEAGLFVPTGVMSNQLAIKAQTEPGDEVIVEAESHIFHYETAAPSLLSGVQLHVLPGENGVVDPNDLEKVIRPDIYYMPPTRLLCLENTHNRYGGAVYPIDLMKAVCDRARKANLRLHLDGARIWNASVASGVPFDDYGRLFDTVSVCFSKGLGAPVGSMLLGDDATITRARRFRKIFGGGMRQTGVIAAAARFAVRNNIERLRVDHENTEAFRQIVSEIPNIILFPRTAPTNMCILDVRNVTDIPIEELLPLLASKGVLMIPSGYRQMRAVVHLDTPKERVVHAAEIVRDTLAAL